MNFKSLLFVLCFALCFGQSEKANAQAESDLVITEIMYNDAGSGTDQLEYVEIYNKGAATIDLSGYSFAGITFTFPAGEMLAASEYAVVAGNPTLMNDIFGITTYDAAGSLSNSGEGIALYDAAGAVMDTVRYDDGGGWPTDADGDGPSLILCDVMADNNDPANWILANTNAGEYPVGSGTTLFASPAMANQCSDVNPPFIVEADASDATTIIVTFSEDIDPVSGADLANYSGGTFSSAMVSGNMVTLIVAGTLSYDTPYTLMVSNVADLANNVMATESVTFVLETPSALVITEIMYNDAGSGTDTLEYIEIHNAGATDIDISGYFLGGATFTFPAGTMIMAGEYVVTAYSASNMMNTFGVMAMEWTGGGLGNSGETVTLFDVAGAIVDEVPYDDAGDWPTEPDGNGFSLVLCDVTTDNALGANWGVSGTAAGMYAGAALYGSPNMANACSTCVPTSSSEDVAICDDADYMLPDGMIVTTSGTYTSVLMASDGCDSTIVTNVTVLPSYDMTETIMLCDGEVYVLSDGTVVSMTGTYMVTELSSAGCDSTMTSDVMISDPIMANATAMDMTCAGNDGSAMANPTGGNAPYTYLWMAGGATATGSTLTGLGAGSYTVEITDANDCMVTAMVTVGDGCTSTCGETSNLTYTLNSTTPLELTLSWNAVSGAEAYQLAGRKTGGNTKVFPETQNTSRTFTSGILYDTDYQWSVKVKCNGVWTNYVLPPATFTTPANPAKNATNGFDIFAEGNNFSTALYPNPTSNAATLELNHAVNFTGEAITSNITITDVTGKVVNTFKTTNSRLTLDVSEYTNGYYFVVVTSGTEKSVEKMMIAH
ncbi:MAG: lamin tail domain-containing protein [Chitinophagales bacterium]